MKELDELDLSMLASSDILELVKKLKKELKKRRTKIK
jgi:hypothetical protein